MKASDRSVVIGVALLGLLAAFWFLALSPKRAELADADAKVDDLQVQLADAEALAASGEQAKAGYRGNYHRLVVLGKAVPSEDDTSSLLVEVDDLAQRSGIEFESIKLSGGGEVAAPAPAQETTVDPGSAPSEAEDSTPVAAPATETAAAALPLGATVGPAGLPVMPYDLHFSGDFFEIADFIDGVNSLVRTTSSGIGIDGRLVTIDGFSLGQDEDAGFPKLVVDLHVTSYVAPEAEGITGGASPAAPPPATGLASAPAGEEPATPTPTATVTP